MAYYCHWPLLRPFLSILLIASFSQRQFVVVQGHLASSSEELSATEMSTADADSAASSEIVDVLIVNPTFSSFNNESPKRVGANRRELLLRQIHQKQQFPPAFSSSSSLTKQRTLRPYFLPVPKAKAIPGPILAKTVANDKLLVKGTKLLARMDFVNAQSTAGLGAEQGRIKLVNGGGDEENRRMDREEEEEERRRTTPPMRMHSNEVGQQQNEGRNGRTLLGGWALKTRIRPKQREEPAFSTSLDEQPEQQQKSSSSRISSAPIQAKIFGQTQKLSRPILAKTQTFDAGPNKMGRIRQHFSTVPLHQSAHSQLPNSLPPSSPQQFHFYFSPSQTTVNQDFTFAPGTPGIVCAYGMPIPVYNTPRKQCIPYSPLCGLAFTCLMDVHAVDQKGQIVENWWTLPGAVDQIIRQSRENAFGALIGSSSSGGGGGATNPAVIGHFGGFPTAINAANRAEWIG